MGLSRRKFTKEFKIAALRQLDAGVSIAAVARSCEINPKFVASLAEGFPAVAGARLSRTRQEKSRREPCRRAGAENRPTDVGDRFLKRCSQRIEEQRMPQALIGKPQSTNRFGKK